MSILLQQKAIPINFKEMMPELSKLNRATHHIHKYPAKLIPQIPNYLINKYTYENDTILDPFCGSGTTLLEAILCNRNALGNELNPVAQLISKVKTTPLDIKELRLASENCYKLIKNCKKFVIPEFENCDLWFTKKAQHELGKIKQSIDSLDIHPDIHDFLLVCFSAIIYKVSNAEQRDIKPRLAKQPNSKNVLNEFLRQLNFNIERMSSLQSLKKKSTIIGGDAKKINVKRKVNMIITSPPYLSAMEYFRTTKLEYYWLNNGNVERYRELARQTIHGELFSGINKELQVIDIPKIDDFVSMIYKKSPKYGFKASKYFSDLFMILQKMHRILLDDGYMAIIIGNSKIMEKRVPLNYFLPLICNKIGFNLNLEMLDEIKFPRLMTKRINHTNRIYNEHVLIFQK